jgi:PleD family two-component response regulator
LDPAQSVAPPLSPGEEYRLAKIDHFLRKAESFFQMARYGAAVKALSEALNLAPADATANALSKRIELHLTLLRNRNGYSVDSPGMVRRRSKRRIILIVDQDERVLIRLATKLRKFGFDTVSALNCKEALETASMIRPDLVISEVNFEDGPSGYELFSELRSRPTTQRVPFLFLATRIDREVLIAGKRLGVDDFLFKPVDDEVVAASVTNCISRSRAETTPR